LVDSIENRTRGVGHFFSQNFVLPILSSGVFIHRKKKVSDIPAGDGNVANLFLQCIDPLSDEIVHRVPQINKHTKRSSPPFQLPSADTHQRKDNDCWDLVFSRIVLTVKGL
jgi:hypothetical protein